MLVFLYAPGTLKGTAFLLDSIASIGWISLASFFLWFTLIFTNNKKVLRVKIFYPLIFFLPVLLIYQQWNGLVSADYIKKSWGWAGVWAGSIWSYLFFTYFITFILLSLFLIYDFAKKTKNHYKQKQAKVILNTAFISLLLSIIIEIVLPELQIIKLPSLANIIILIWAGGLVYSIVEYQLMTVTPSIAAEKILSTMADSLLLLDKKGIIMTVNDALCKLTGYREEELKGKKVDLFFTEKDFYHILLNESFNKDKLTNKDIFLKSIDNKIIPVLISCSTIISDAGDLSGIVCVIRDITGRKKMEDSLRKSQEEAANLFQNSPLAGIYHEKSGNILNINQKFTQLFGYSPKEIIGRNINEGMIFPVEETVKESNYLTQLTIEGKDIEYETIRKKKDGTLVPVIITVAPIVNQKKNQTVIAFYQDRTKYKEILEKITESEKKYHTLFDNMPAAYYQADKNGKLIMMNPTGIRLLGFESLSEVVGKNMAEDFYYKPKERKTFLKLLEENKGGIKGYESTLKTKCGNPLMVSTNSQYYYNEAGDIEGVEGIFIDVTERKKTEDALKKSREEFASLFVSSPEALVYVDENSSIIDINPRFRELFGYSKNEVKGTNINNGMIHPEEKRKEAEYLFKKSLISNYYNYETIRKRKNGSIIPVSISSSTVIIDGQPKGRIISYSDITVSKHNELIQQVLYNISKAANSTVSIDILYKIIHTELSKLINTNNFYIALLDKEKEEINFPYSVDEFKHIHHSRKIDHQSLIAYIFEIGESVCVNQEKICQNPLLKRYKKWFGKLRKAWVGVPLKIEGDTIGGVVVQSYNNPDCFSPQDIHLMEFISSQISIAIKRKLDEEALRKSQQEFLSLFRSNPEAAVYTNETGNVININSMFTELFGYSLAEIKGKNIDSGLIQPPELIDEAKDLTLKGIRKGHVGFETTRKKKDGSLFPVYISASPVIVNSNLKGIIAVYYNISERKETEEKLKKLSRIDSLTGCYNRRYGMELIERQIKLSNRSHSPLLLAYLDIDNFKYINDNYGHLEGDRVIKKIANILKDNLREIDIICRLGGDEFLLLFPNSSLQESPLIRKRLQEAFSKLNIEIQNDYRIKFSIGFSEYMPNNTMDLDELIAIADKQMYKEKGMRKKR